MTGLVFGALYALGAVLMSRRFDVLIAVELSDEPVATLPARRAPLIALVLWPLAVALLVGADLWVAVARNRARPRSLQWRS